KRVYDRFSTLLEMKKMVFKPTDRQQIGGGSHTFTTADGSKSIIIGMNVTDDWDETVKDGLDRVNDWITSLIEDSDGKTRTLVGMIRDLLKPTSGGKLKASRIMDLSNKAEELGDEKLIDAVKIIEQAYSPRNSSMYIVAQYRDDKGREVRIPLSMSAV
ncbi:MAG: DUF3164 family protein, partial [Bacteroidales bacterium]|nr:DUF3164 family protein [Bacteroidales bacterium]